MNRPLPHRLAGTPFPADRSPAVGNNAGVVQSCPRTAPAALITADARTVSPRGFLEALGLTSPEMREARRQQEIERCIRAIERGDTFGWPPVMVAECRHIMAMRSGVRL